MSSDMKIKWHKSGNNQWTANIQKHNSIDYSGVINFASNVYTLTANPGAVVTPCTTLKNAKNVFRKFLFNK